MKTCSRCHISKDESLFEKSKHATCGLRPECKICRSKILKKYYLENKEKYKTRAKKYRSMPGYSEKARLSQKRYRDKVDSKTKQERWLNYSFGISLKQYEELFIKQNGNCAICKINQSQLNKNLAVDHCHITGKIRGLLCIPCNVALGNFKDNIESLKSAIHYLFGGALE